MEVIKMPDTPLNPAVVWNLRALADEGTRELRHVVLEPDLLHKLLDIAESVAQPEVNSVEELDALPPESYVQGWDGFKHAKTHSGEWVLCVEHTRGAHNAESIELPARVLYRPEVNDA